MCTKEACKLLAITSAFDCKFLVTYPHRCSTCTRGYSNMIQFFNVLTFHYPSILFIQTRKRNDASSSPLLKALKLSLYVQTNMGSRESIFKLVSKYVAGDSNHFCRICNSVGERSCHLARRTILSPIQFNEHFNYGIAIIHRQYNWKPAGNLRYVFSNVL